MATSTQLGDFVRAVGGDRVDLHQILQPNTDPHEYEPRPEDVRATAGAKVVFTSGDNLDAWMKDVVSEAGGSPSVIDVGATVPVKLPGESSGAEASRFDPHWWHDPVNVEAAIGTIREGLTAADPAGAGRFAANARAYLRKLRALDSGISACFRAVPPAQRKLVTDHDAFAYFANRYGIEVVGAVIPSQTTQAQASAGDVARLAAHQGGGRLARSFPRARSAPSSPRRSPARPGRRRTTPCTATPSGRPTPRERPTSGWRRPTPTRWCGALRGTHAGARSRGSDDRLTTTTAGATSGGELLADAAASRPAMGARPSSRGSSSPCTPVSGSECSARTGAESPPSSASSPES